jgi:hypothetical protein
LSEYSKTILTKQITRITTDFIIHGRYGIGSFVYQARRPFHPRRLWDLVSAPFAILQTTFEDDDEDDDSDADAEMEVTGDAESETEDAEMYDEEKAKAETLRQLQADKAALDLPARAKVKRESLMWKGLLRSKGKPSSTFSTIASMF